MPITNRKGTTGGIGNEGMFIERDPSVCAAGIPSTKQEPVSSCLKYYALQDEVDALLHDSIAPPPRPKKLPPLRKPPRKDMRFAGYTTEAADLINPPTKTKFEALVQDFKETQYTSYWKKRLSFPPDPTPMLPNGMNPETTTFGKKLTYEIPLYDIVFPKIPLPDKTPLSERPGVQTDRKYCSPPYDSNQTFGEKKRVPNTGIFAKCVLTENTKPYFPLNTTQANYYNRIRTKPGKVLAPNNNISEVPLGNSFGVISKPDNLPQCLTPCTLNPGNIQLKKCLAHLNSVRKNLSKRYAPNFFNDFYLKLRHLDTKRTGCLPCSIVYDEAMKEMLRFDASMIEPLLAMWNAFDGSLIKYKTFVLMLNYREHLPDLLKVPDMAPECNDFRTTYSEMVKPGQEADPRHRAGIPSARYFDLDVPKAPIGGCGADIALLPEELTVGACLTPSIMTLNFVNHRDLYCTREPEALRAIFKKAEVEFSDETFQALWKKAKRYHSKGLVCIESFRQAMSDNTDKVDNKSIN